MGVKSRKPEVSGRRHSRASAALGEARQEAPRGARASKRDAEPGQKEEQEATRHP